MEKNIDQAALSRRGMPQNRLGEFVSNRRRELGLTSQRDLARQMTSQGGGYIDSNYITQLESGRIDIPRQPKLGQLATALQTTQTDILRTSGVITDPLPDIPNPFDPLDPRATIFDALPKLDNKNAEFIRLTVVFILNNPLETID